MDRLVTFQWSEATSKVQDAVKTTGNAFGYETIRRGLLQGVEEIEWVRFSDDADMVLHLCPPESFEPVSGKKNWLFTMVESMDVPSEFLRIMGKADVLVVPTKWNQSIFRPHFPEKPVFVVPLGVRDVFSYVDRSLPAANGTRFRFLWAGAPNLRKGIDEVQWIWGNTAIGKSKSLELYIKTSFGWSSRKPTGVFRIGKNVILDTRPLSPDGMFEVYRDAHCFLFPTRGEGFGLTLAEAMRTGLPCIATGYGGVTEFFDHTVGYPTKYFIGRAEFTYRATRKTEWSPKPGIYKYDGRIGMCEVGDMVAKMLRVLHNYDEALEKGRKAHERIADEFTWKRSVERLASHMRVVSLYENTISA